MGYFVHNITREKLSFTEAIIFSTIYVIKQKLEPSPIQIQEGTKLQQHNTSGKQN
jgi:hypothetical protein